MWCSQCQLEHSGNKCPLVAASSVEAIEGYQQHLERKFWEQAYCAMLMCPSPDAHSPKQLSYAELADRSLDAWRDRWGKK
jgi:hypothetical protein